MPVPGTIEVGQLITRLEEEIIEAVDRAVGETVELGMMHARRLAPVRKVSYIERNRQTRDLSRAEIASLPASIRASAQRIQRSGGRVLTTVRQSRQAVEAPEVDFDDITERARGLKNPGVRPHLTHRGLKELEIAKRIPVTLETPYRRRDEGIKLSRSAVFVSGSGSNRSATLGGRLRGEIETVPATRRGGIITGWVISPTEYARYVEFPTSRTAAQPYMRPTLKFLKRPFVNAVHRQLRKSGFRPTSQLGV